MSKNLTFTEINEIERLLYFKANTILDEARTYLGRLNYDLAVRRSQEAFELFLKSLFRFLQAQYPSSHDLKKQIYDLAAAFKQNQVDPNQIRDQQIARLVLANSMLDIWRLPAFYGDEKLNVGDIFEEGEAKLALTYAELAQYLCEVVRSHVQQRAANAQAT